MASEVISDIKIELSDLNNLCCHASLASKCFHEMIKTYGNEEIYHPLTCVATPQVKIVVLQCFEVRISKFMIIGPIRKDFATSQSQ